MGFNIGVNLRQIFSAPEGQNYMLDIKTFFAMQKVICASNITMPMAGFDFARCQRMKKLGVLFFVHHIFEW